MTQEKANKLEDEAYRIVEAMGLGLTFRSCTCGQLPCARLRPIRDALEAARKETVKEIRQCDKCDLCEDHHG